MASSDSFGAKGTIQVGGAEHEIFRLSAVDGAPRSASVAALEPVVALVVPIAAFADYLRQSVAEPLQMISSELVGPAGHGARSTVDDLSRFAGELLSPTLLSTETVAAATSVQFPGLDGFVPGYGKHRPNDWGLGFEIRSDKRPHWTGPRNSPRTFGHFGQTGTFLWVDPELRTACVVLTDRQFGAWAKPLWSEFNDSVVAEISR